MPETNPLLPPYDFGVPPWEIAGPLGALPSASERDARLTSGYRMIQAEQVRAADQTYQDFPELVELWYECLTLAFEALDGLEGVDVTQRPQMLQETRSARFYIFAQHVGVSKCGLDSTLSAVYSPALWSIRNVLEATWHMGYLRINPNEGQKWYMRVGIAESSNQLPSWRTAFGAVKGAAGRQYGPYYESLKEIHELANKGSHPSKELFGLPLSQDGERFSVGPNYSSQIAERILTRGVTAVIALLVEFNQTEPTQEAWFNNLQQVNSRLQALLKT